MGAVYPFQNPFSMESTRVTSLRQREQREAYKACERGRRQAIKPRPSFPVLKRFGCKPAERIDFL